MIASHYQREAEYTEHNAEQYEEIRSRLTITDIKVLHHAIGLATESGELADNLKKYIFYGKAIDITNIKEELGDLLWYVAGMCNALGLSLESVMQTNNTKLKARYPSRFNAHDALNRDLDNERRILEDG